jgi:hypothetical protein
MIYLEAISWISKVVMFLTTVYLFYIGFRNDFKPFSLKTFWYLSLFSIIDSIIYILTIIIFNRNELFFTISKWWQLIYIFVEFIIISNFLFEINGIKNKKILNRYIFIALFIVGFLTILKDWNFTQSYYTIFTGVELIIINTFTIRFLLSISHDQSELKAKSERIIAIGLFLFINIASPYYIIFQIISSKPNNIISSLSFLSNIAYIVFFASIIKSIKWQTRN